MATRFFAFAAFAIMVLVAGFRDEYVGTDTRAYTTAFEQYLSFADQWEGSVMEPGYSVLKHLAGYISTDYWALLVTIAAVVVFCHMWSIYKYSGNPTIALFIFITMGYYTFFFNGARQGIACAIFTIAFGALIEGNFKKYALGVMVAFLFHKSVIIALPLYFLFRQKFTKYIFFALAIAALSVFFFQFIYNLGTFISERYAKYQEIESTGGYLLTLFYTLLSIFFVFFRINIPPANRKVYDCFLNMLIFGTMIYVMVILSGAYIELTRIAFYFQIASIFLWPLVFKNIRASSMRYILGIGLVSAQLVFFYIFLSKIGNLTPYEFNETVVRWFS